MSEKIILSILAGISVISSLLAGVVLLAEPIQRSVEHFQKNGNPEEALQSKTVPSTDVGLAEKILKEAGAENVEIIISDDEINCALWDKNLLGIQERIKTEDGKFTQGGCWREETPDTIYLSSGITYSESLKFVALHEYAHVLQWREEWPLHSSGIGEHPGSAECMADVWAHNHGAPEWSLFYFETDENCEDYKQLLNK